MGISLGCGGVPLCEYHGMWTGIAVLENLSTLDSAAAVYAEVHLYEVKNIWQQISTSTPKKLQISLARRNGAITLNDTTNFLY